MEDNTDEELLVDDDDVANDAQIIVDMLVEFIEREDDEIDE